MTDYTKLIDDVIDYNASDERPRAALQSAIEALRATQDRQSMQLAHDTVTIEGLNDKVMALLAENERLKAKADDHESELADEQSIWPQWATAVLQSVRERSGYDGYDDEDGVDLPSEVGECLSELENIIEKRTTERDQLQSQLDAMGKGEPVAPEQVEAAWRAGWAACRDAEYVGQEAEDEAWGMSQTCANADWESAAPKALAPLTDEQVYFGQWDDGSGSSADFREGARFAERHHGIGGTP